MKQILLILLVGILLSACAAQPQSQSAYKPANNAGFGYKEILLGQNNYRVEFKAAGGSVKKAQDYALLRAAELTSAQGYDWFVVDKQDKFTKGDVPFSAVDLGSSPKVMRNCGVLGCKASDPLAPDLMIDKDETLFPEVKVVLAIHFGKGIRPATKNTYDAVETIENLRAKR